ncbi:MAG: GNAT family N-acetyltransferase [Bacteroidales bacterium]|nr:GNAT family N-acetyltransferase [Bacteroidales bacterium]
MITINKLEFNDLRGLKELYEDAFEGSFTDYDKMILSFNQINNNPNYIILCAKSDGKVVGSVMGVICHELFGQCNPFMVIEDVAVLETHRRLGIAKSLMIRMEEHARQAGCCMIEFVSSEHRKGAHKLYESLGYGVDKVNGYRKRLNDEVF